MMIWQISKISCLELISLKPLFVQRWHMSCESCVPASLIMTKPFPPQFKCESRKRQEKKISKVHSFTRPLAKKLTFQAKKVTKNQFGQKNLTVLGPRPKEDNINLFLQPPPLSLRYTWPKVNTVGSRVPPAFTSEKRETAALLKKEIEMYGTKRKTDLKGKKDTSNIVEEMEMSAQYFLTPALLSWRCRASFILLATRRKFDLTKTNTRRFMRSKFITFFLIELIFWRHLTDSQCSALKRFLNSE